MQSYLAREAQYSLLQLLIQQTSCSIDSTQLVHGWYRPRNVAACIKDCMKVIIKKDRKLCEYLSRFFQECSEFPLIPVCIDKLTAGIINGITAGHSCCMLHDCKELLNKQYNTFCLTHKDLHFECHID